MPKSATKKNCMNVLTLLDITVKKAGMAGGKSDVAF
jgi:hypothetical protein